MTKIVQVRCPCCGYKMPRPSSMVRISRNYFCSKSCKEDFSKGIVYWHGEINNYREAIPPKLRFSILMRDKFTCVYCGRNSKDGVKLNVDHLVPYKIVKENKSENLVTACQECNAGKSDLKMPKNIIQFFKRG